MDRSEKSMFLNRLRNHSTRYVESRCGVLSYLAAGGNPSDSTVSDKIEGETKGNHSLLPVRVSLSLEMYHDSHRDRESMPLAGR